MSLGSSHSEETSYNEHDGLSPASKKVTVYGWDSDNLQKVKIKVDSNGHQQVDVVSLPSVTISAEDIEIGAVEIKNSTDDTRATVDANGLNVNVKATVGLKPADTLTKVTTVDSITNSVTVQQSTASNLKIDLSGTGANSTAIKVDGSAVTQPISASSLPLPSGAATSANQTDGSQKSQSIDTGGNNIGGKLYDVNSSTYKGLLFNAGSPQICSQSYLEAIAEGDITGHTPWSKIGYNPAITTSEEDIWSAGGSYVFPAAATIMEVISSSVNADDDIGTILFNATCDTGGTTTTLLDSGVDFTATAAAGDYLILDKSGTTPEWGIITAVANGSLTFANGLSSGGSCVTARTYQVLDSSAAKGAMAVKVDYLDANYAAKTEIIILNANTAVDSINQMFRINSFRVIAVGSKSVATNSAIGNLTLRADAAGTTYSYILAGYTRARNIMYTVPAGKTLYVNMWQAGASTSNDTKVQTARIFTKANREPSTGFGDGIFYTYTELLVSNNMIAIVFPIPTKLIQKTDIKVSAIGLTGFSGPVTSVLRGWLENN